MASPSSPLDDLLAAELAHRTSQSLLRTRVEAESAGPVRIHVAGREYVNFASNDYLGLSHHPRLKAAVADAVKQYGAGAAAAPLISGHTLAHAAAEAALAQWKGTQAAILLPSGYQAAHAIIQTLATAVPNVRFLVDRLAHASLIDATRASESQMRIFPHNGLEKLARLLETGTAGQIQVLITESIYSMDGDAAPLQKLAALCSTGTTLPLPVPRGRAGVGASGETQTTPITPRFVWLLDEAHGSGTYGPNGSGLAAELDMAADVDIYLVTLSKSLGLAGGAICASRQFCDAVVNFGRAYIYSTAVSPAIAGAIPTALELLCTEPQRQKRVRELAMRVRDSLTRADFVLPQGDSPIIPILLGDESAAITAAERLKSAGLWVQPIRPPTVPRGTSRLRITLSAEHSDADIQRLIDALVVARASGQAFSP